MSSSKRHFTAVVGSKEHGLYISSSPSSAARKIVSKLCASSKSKKVEFCVRETTQKSEKKTYGPYLGEMKKLAKPIELKGRIIRYAPVVLLKKKKTAIKTAKKIGKKMRGGTITNGGELSKEDFLIENVKIVEKNNNEGGISRARYFNIEGFDEIENCKLVIKNNFFKEPFIFFCKTTDRPNVSFTPSVHYKYVVFNEGIFLKTVKFKEVILEINRMDFSINYTFPDVDISNIPISALEHLKEFISNQRITDPTFCSKLYSVVEIELKRPLELQPIKKK
jgi:hypothetical protein